MEPSIDQLVKQFSKDLELATPYKPVAEDGSLLYPENPDHFRVYVGTKQYNIVAKDADEAKIKLAEWYAKDLSRTKLRNDRTRELNAIGMFVFTEDLADLTDEKYKELYAQAEEAFQLAQDKKREEEDAAVLEEDEEVSSES